MDKAIIEYKKRRQARLDSKKGSEREPKYDSIEEFKKRREARMNSRMDAGVGWVFGVLKQNGVDTEGMSVSEAFKELKKLNGGGNNKENQPEDEGSAKKKEKSSSVKAQKSGDVKGSSYVGEFKTSGGVSYPKLKKGAVYDEDTLKEVNRLADSAENNKSSKTKEQEKAIKSLTSKDITYQRDPDGTVVGSIPGLSQMYDTVVTGKSKEVQDAYSKRIEQGKQITKDMVSISDKLGSRMMGLENCFKGGDSTSRKIDKVKAKWKEKGVDLTDEQALEKMDDVVRFSYKCDHGKMVDQIKGLESELEKNGYEITERDNKFLPKEDGTPRDYKAVHLQVKSPSGELFEVQIQSEETIKVKNKNHSLYEKSRVLDEKNPKQAAEKKKLVDEMVDNWSGMVEPDGIMELRTFKKKQNVAQKVDKNGNSR